jgi:PIN domain
MSDSKNWPRKVFLESTVLFQLGNKLQKPEFAKLTERRDYLKFDLLVSEVSWAEYIRQRTDKIDALTTDLQSCGTRLREWDQDPKHLQTSQSELAEYRRKVQNLYEEKAKEVGIQVLGLPPIEVNRLFRMSIERIPPFEKSREDKSEKGFRDSLIMFTILESIKGKTEDHALVITEDQRLTEGLISHAEQFQTELSVVPSLDDAVAHIEARVGTWYREVLLKQSEEAISMLNKYRQPIIEQVNKIRELTEADLGVGGFFGGLAGSKGLTFGETVERVNSLNLEEIESAVWKDRDKPESRILFRIRCIAKVATSGGGNLSPFFASQSKFVVGGGKQEGVPSFLMPSYVRKEERERALPVSLYGEASFQRTNGDWKLIGVRVDTSQPGQDDFAALISVPKRKT